MIEEQERDETASCSGCSCASARQEDRLEISIAEVLSDVEHELDVLASLEKEGVERELQELLADAPEWCGEGCGWCGASGRPTSGPST